VASVLGKTVSEPTPQDDNPPVRVCNYAAGANPRSVIIRYETGSDAARFGQARAEFESHGEKTADVTGVGDQAYSSLLGSTGTLVARKGSTEVLITGPAGIDAERQLMLQILPKV
jgi:hypothetical protein